MIKKTRKRLIMTNYIVFALVTSVIFVLLGMSIFIAVSKSIEKDMMYVGSVDLSQIKDSDFVDDMNEHKFNYIEIDEDHRIIKRLDEIKFEDDELEALIAKILVKNEKVGVANLEDSKSYEFMVIELENAIRIIYINAGEKLMVTLGHMGMFPIMWIVGLILLYPISVFLADRSLEPIKTSWKHQLEFTADASHEIRSPITSIITNLEIVLSEPKASIASQSKWLNNIKMESIRISHLINDLLTLARADSSEQLVDKEEFYLTDTFHDIIHNFEATAKKGDYKFTHSIEESIYCFGDVNRIQQLITILLDNAFKYTPHGGNIDVSLEKIKKNIVITIADTGVGIESSQLESIFERFYRSDKARSRNEGGAGLGLSIAKWIVTEHMGNIEATSVKKLGSTFIVELPLIQK